MPSKVYLARCSKNRPLGENALHAFKNAGLDSIISPGLVALKTHFGEPGNTSYVRYDDIEPTVELLKEKGAQPYFAETSTLYRGRRSNAVDHFHSAAEHGFSYEKTGCPLLFVDGLKGNNHAEVEVGLKHFDRVAIAHDFVLTPSAVIFTHVTGHELAGLGGAIKNLAMGLASRAGKLRQHDSGKPMVDAEACTACGTCAEWCPSDAIDVGKAAFIDNGLCIACGECLTLCPEHAIDFSWSESAASFSEKMAEYALGALKGKLQRSAFLSYVWQVTNNCNCKGQEMDTMCGDLGVLASTDPVAIDQAAAELIADAEGHDVFKKHWPDTNYEAQLVHGEEIGLGTRDYKLIEVNQDA